MKENMERAISWVIVQETGPGHEQDGAYHCEPGDKGGCTKFGIAQKWHPNINVEFLTREDAIKIYEAEYWHQINGDMLSNGIDLLVLDFSVTSSPGRAMRKLMESMVGGPDTDTLVTLYSVTRRRYYQSIVVQDPTQGKFLHDWLKRVDLAEAEAKKWRGTIL